MAIIFPSTRRELDRQAQRISDLTRDIAAAEQAKGALATALSAKTAQHNSAVGQVNALTGQVNELTGRVNELTGMVNELTGQINTIPRSAGHDVVGDTGMPQGLVNSLTGQVNALTGQVNELTDQVNQLTGRANDLTGERNQLIGKVNELTGERNARNARDAELTVKVSALTGQVNELTGQINALTGERNQLIGKVNELTGDRNAGNAEIGALHNRLKRFSLASGDEVSAVADESVRAPALPGVVRQRSSRFLIVSNMRTGSTWLQTALGALSDVTTDYELKWDPLYKPSQGHLVLHEASPPIADLLDRFDGDTPVVGSKLVLDPIGMTEYDFNNLVKKIGRDVRVIHLMRQYRDIFLSRRRGAYHRASNAAHKVGAHLNEAIQRSNRAMDAAASPKSAVVPPLECFNELSHYLNNDALLARLEGMVDVYFEIEYDDISQRFGEIAKRVGSAAPDREISAVLAAPPLERLTPVDAAALVSNIASLEPLFRSAETLRHELIRR